MGSVRTNSVLYQARASIANRTFRSREITRAKLRGPPPASASPSLAALRRGWAQLIRRVFEVDPLVCPRCQGVMRVVAFITEPRVIRRFLDHLGASRSPRLSRVALRLWLPPRFPIPSDPPGGRGRYLHVPGRPEAASATDQPPEARLILLEDRPQTAPAPRHTSPWGNGAAAAPLRQGARARSCPLPHSLPPCC